MAEPKRKKSELIREYLGKYPNMGPTEMATLMMAEIQDFSILPQEISKMKSTGKSRTAAGYPEEIAGRAPLAVQKEPCSGLADRLRKLKEAAEAVGGPEEAMKVLNLLKWENRQ